ncbi:flagellin, partial [Campylobacter sp. Cr9]|uniref:flagellin n=1 Tax=Campylobacter sp. Cr9 TaxID=2735728 RepID=UPI0030142362
IKAGTTTSGFSINGVQIGTVDVKDKDANGALRAAINAVKDQTGVEASVDAKGRLVLANRDGRGIKVEDNTTGAAPAKDFHNLVTQGKAGQDNVKKAVDLNVGATWTTAAGTEGSIKNKDNSFADVKNALGAQDAQIRKDATDTAKAEALATKAANDIADVQNKAIDELKTKLSDGLDTFRKGLTLKANANQADFNTLQSAFITAISTIEKATSLEAISDALTTLDGVASTGASSLATVTDQKIEDLHDLAAGSVKTYAETMQKAVKATQQSFVDNGVDVTKGTAQTVNDALTDYKAQLDTQLGTTGFNTAGNTAANAKARFDAIAALAPEDTAYNTAVADVVGKEVILTNLALPTTGAMQMAANDLVISDASTDPDMKAINDMFKDLKAQTTIEGANASLKKIDDKLKELVDGAVGKSMDSKEAQKGIIAHSLQQYFSAVKTSINEPEAGGLGNMIGLNATNSTNMGRLSLVANNGRDIQVEVKDANGFIANSALGFDKNVSEKTVSLRETNAKIDVDTADAMGFNNEEWQATDAGDNVNGYAAGVMTLKGAQAMMNIAETAQKALEAIRSDLGSVQNQLVSTVNNISVTQVNVKAAESNIRDVDFAEESATFSKHQILAQSGVYAMSQANAVQQNVMRLLQ